MQRLRRAMLQGMQQGVPHGGEFPMFRQMDQRQWRRSSSGNRSHSPLQPHCIGTLSSAGAPAAGVRCAPLWGVSASTADFRRVPNQHPAGGSHLAYSDPENEVKVVHTEQQLFNEEVKPVLKGEALSDARMFALTTYLTGESTGLNTDKYLLLHTLLGTAPPGHHDRVWMPVQRD